MAAKSQEVWFNQLKSWVPSWWFSEIGIQEAHFQALAKVLSTIEQSMLDTVNDTFIDRASEEYLDLHGHERLVYREQGEPNSLFSIRVKTKSLKSQVAKQDLVRIINQFLIRGQASIKEDFEGSVFYDRGSYFNRAEILLEPAENTFTIVVDKQIHEPWSFFSREFFFNREGFIGSSESAEDIFQLIIRAVDDNKAAGVFYRIIERLS